MRPLALHSQGPITFAARIALVLIACAGVSLQARESGRWIEVRSPHFTVVSTGREDDVRRVALAFERVRALLRRVDPDARVDSRDPVVVLAVTNDRGLRELLPQFWEQKSQRPVAAYWRGPYRQCLALRIDAAERERDRRVLHEYLHLLTHANVADLPAWLDEGVSEFWATAIVRDDAVEVGRPAAQTLQVLRARRPWIPIDELLAMDRVPDAANKQRLAQFYAQSWALVHYSMVGGATMNVRLAPAVDTSRPSELESAVASYVAAGHFRAVRFDAPTSEAAARPNTIGSTDAFALRSYGVRTLAPAASLAVRAGCLAEGERPAAAIGLLATAAAENPDDAFVAETMGYAHFVQNQPGEAAQWFDRAIASGTVSHLAYFYRSILAGPVPNRADGSHVSAEDDLQKSIDLAPNFAPAYIRLGGLLAARNDTRADAIPLLERATDLEPDNPTSWTDLGRLFFSLHRPAEARRAGQKALAVARSASSRRLVAAFFDEIGR